MHKLSYSLCFLLKKYHGKKSELGRDAADLRKAYLKAKMDNAKFFEDILGQPQKDKDNKEGKHHLFYSTIKCILENSR